MQTKPIAPPPVEVAKPMRSDGAQARERLLAEALRLFSEHGFAKTSTRAIAQAAGVNISAISYYFGDKEGLYRTALSEPFSGQDVQAHIDAFSDPKLTLQEALERFFTQLLAPLQQGATMQHCMRLHMREMLDPSGLWQQEIERRVVPTQQALARVVGRHVGLGDAFDEDIQRLVLAMTAMPIHFMVAQDVVMAVCPSMLQHPEVVPTLVDTVVRYALALIQAERVHRQGLAGGAA